MLEAVLDTFSLVLYLQTPLGVARLGGHRVSAATLEISLSLKTASPCSLNQSYLARVDVNHNCSTVCIFDQIPFKK